MCNFARFENVRCRERGGRDSTNDEDSREEPNPALADTSDQEYVHFVLEKGDNLSP